jgi:hypothetical protein
MVIKYGKMWIEYANGQKEYVADEEAARAILDRLYPDAVYNEDWEDAGEDDGKYYATLKVWEDEETAGPLGAGDDGSAAIAWIMSEVEEVA